MMTVGHVLDYKNAGHSAAGAHQVGNIGQAALPQQDLPSTFEYKAWDALQAGRVKESQELVQQLLQQERAQSTALGLSDAEHLLTVERRIRNVLVAAEKVTAMNKFKVAEAVTDFLWEDMATPQ